MEPNAQYIRFSEQIPRLNIVTALFFSQSVYARFNSKRSKRKLSLSVIVKSANNCVQWKTVIYLLSDGIPKEINHLPACLFLTTDIHQHKVGIISNWRSGVTNIEANKYMYTWRGGMGRFRASRDPK